ncbi:MAG: four helix bundle protein [Ruminococcus sp.]|nr:four helix bundle protein [Ruminococcus sp.]
MNSNFALLNNSKKTIAYINKQLINYPKSELVLKQNIEKNMYEIIELIFSYSINDVERIKIKFLKDLIIKLSMLDFYISTSFEKRIISKKKFESTSMYIIEIRKIAYGLVKNVTKC